MFRERVNTDACSSLAWAMADFERFDPHDVYEARLRRKNERKNSL